MQVLILEPLVPVQDRLVVKDIGEDYEDLRSAVGGPIEFFTLKIEGHYFDLILHEEGKLEGLRPNIAIFNDGAIIDLVVGQVVIAKANDEGNTIALTDLDVSIITNYFKSNHIVVGRGGEELFTYYYE